LFGLLKLLFKFNKIYQLAAYYAFLTVFFSPHLLKNLSSLIGSSSSFDQLHQAGVCVSVRPGLEKKNRRGDKAEGPIWRDVASGKIFK